MKILVKECDRLKSSLHKGRYVSEYIIYLIDKEIPIECHTVIGLDAKNDKILDLITYNFNDQLSKLLSSEEITLDGVLGDNLTELTFEEFLNQ
jgi:hypothetical protein